MWVVMPRNEQLYEVYFSTAMDGSKRPFQILLMVTVLPKYTCPGTSTLKLPL